MTEQRPSTERAPIEPHAARDRFGKTALRTAAAISGALAGPEGGEDPVVLRTDRPHVSIAGLRALLDEALRDEDDAVGRSGSDS
ncbi:hypothetical protein [Geodermatophilus ruber]|uniref:Uncharacterized protein n=1 Tax=Geodermatophilus ruber TaxID=504800 RepID=A0A1I4EGT6_9ACTN|nr:hypothetical protein [Geodermatophilus ruber]SFL04988.1 hypothetical protein SAMN04488085_10626 [Geodermatophilus ruber]